MDENAVNRLLCSTADFLPEPAGQGETASYFGVAKRLNYVRAGLDFFGNLC